MSLNKFLTGQVALAIEFGEHGRMTLWRPGHALEWQVTWVPGSEKFPDLPDFGNKLNLANLRSVFENNNPWVSLITKIEQEDLHTKLQSTIYKA